MIGAEIHDFAKSIWHFNRSLTGQGVRDTLEEMQKYVPNLVIKSFKSGTNVFDWQIPQEWEVYEAFIKTPSGDIICNFKSNNLHLVGYSTSFEGELSLEELDKKLHSLPNLPSAIPYVTSYYNDYWGFCISDEKRNKLEEGNYYVVIKTKHFDGEMNYGELLIPGKNKEEIFLSTYVCHPSMANNELSGPAVLTFLAKWLSEIENKYTYRIVFVPETIGSIAYLSENLDDLKKRVIAGYNISCVGDNRTYSYLPSRHGDTISDKVAKHVLKYLAKEFKQYSWLDRGSDERQYCSPGIDLPIASIMRTKYGDYPEYHTSLDNLENVVTPEGLNGGYWALRTAIELIENNDTYKTKTLCEPHLSKRNLYPTISDGNVNFKYSLLLDILSYSDGRHDVIQIADKLSVPAWTLYESISLLIKNQLLEHS